MKVAILISGRPRFTREFDDLLNNLKNYEQVDWYFLLWNATHEQDVRVPPTWPTDPFAIRERISSKLPANHNIACLEITEPPEYNSTVDWKLTPWSVAQNIWTMYYGIYRINNIRETLGKYDLVIRTRPDVGIAEELDLVQIKNQLQIEPNTVLMPNNKRFGLRGSPVNDLFGIALPEVMTVYADAFNHLEEYNEQGVLFHGETILSHHLAVNNIATPNTTFNSVMRHYTKDGQPLTDDNMVDHGRWNE